jgi:hypothetical protein
MLRIDAGRKQEGGGSFLVQSRKGIQFHNVVRLDADTFLTSARECIATRDFLEIDLKRLLNKSRERETPEML